MPQKTIVAFHSKVLSLKYIYFSCLLLDTLSWNFHLKLHLKTLVICVAPPTEAYF